MIKIKNTELRYGGYSKNMNKQELINTIQIFNKQILEISVLNELDFLKQHLETYPNELSVEIKDNGCYIHLSNSVLGKTYNPEEKFKPDYTFLVLGNDLRKAQIFGEEINIICSSGSYLGLAKVIEHIETKIRYIAEKSYDLKFIEKLETLEKQQSKESA